MSGAVHAYIRFRAAVSIKQRSDAASSIKSNGCFSSGTDVSNGDRY